MSSFSDAIYKKDPPKSVSEHATNITLPERITATEILRRRANADASARLLNSTEIQKQTKIQRFLGSTYEEIIVKWAEEIIKSHKPLLQATTVGDHYTAMMTDGLSRRKDDQRCYEAQYGPAPQIPQEEKTKGFFIETNNDDRAAIIISCPSYSSSLYMRSTFHALMNHLPISGTIPAGLLCSPL